MKSAQESNYFLLSPFLLVSTDEGPHENIFREFNKESNEMYVYRKNGKVDNNYMDILFSLIFMSIIIVRTRRRGTGGMIIKAAYHHKANKGAQMLIREIITYLYYSHTRLYYYY